MYFCADFLIDRRIATLLRLGEIPVLEAVKLGFSVMHLSLL
jgi:hypothetical protein